MHYFPRIYGQVQIRRLKLEKTIRLLIYTLRHYIHNNHIIGSRPNLAITIRQEELYLYTYFIWLLSFVHPFRVSKRTSTSLSDRWRDAIFPSIFQTNSGTERPAAGRADLYCAVSAEVVLVGLVLHAMFTFSLSPSRASLLSKLALWQPSNIAGHAMRS